MTLGGRQERTSARGMDVEPLQHDGHERWLGTGGGGELGRVEALWCGECNLTTCLMQWFAERTLLLDY